MLWKCREVRLRPWWTRVGAGGLLPSLVFQVALGTFGCFRLTVDSNKSLVPRYVSEVAAFGVSSIHTRRDMLLAQAPHRMVVLGYCGKTWS